MHREKRPSTLSILAAGVVLVLSIAAAHAQTVVNLGSEPSGPPTADNNYNCTVVDSPESGIFTVSTSGPVSSVTGTSASLDSSGQPGKFPISGVSPTELPNGNTTFNVAPSTGLDVFVIHYKSGKRRCVVFKGKYVKDFFFSAPPNGGGPLNVNLTFEDPDITWQAIVNVGDDWIPRPSPPSAQPPAPKPSDDPACRTGRPDDRPAWCH